VRTHRPGRALRPGVQAHTLGVLDDTQPARDALTSIKQVASLFRPSELGIVLAMPFNWTRAIAP